MGHAKAAVVFCAVENPSRQNPFVLREREDRNSRGRIDTRIVDRDSVLQHILFVQCDSLDEPLTRTGEQR